MRELGRVIPNKPVSTTQAGQQKMAESFTSEPGRDGGFSFADDGQIVTVTHPDWAAPLYIPWGSIAHAWGPLPVAEAKPVPPALGDVLVRRGAEEPPPPKVVDLDAVASKLDSSGIPAALRPPAGAETVPNYISAEKAAAMSPEQFEALTADGVQILPPTPPAGPKGEFPGKKKP